MLDTLEAVKATKGRILGVDFGDVRTGLAVSDETRFLAQGIGYIRVPGLAKAAAAVAEEAKSRGVTAVIVGLPTNMDGSLGPRAAHATEFAEALRELTGLPVATFDERMTTMAAARYLNDTNTRGKNRKAVIDTLSAQIILQNVLDRLARM
ncbi:MAG: Holliday junction resolvase RuvX [Clostridia bacterium]|nr:Holliday junction resolvase RuvX [Clostridia bacterium]